MKTITYTIKDELGIHARPAGMLAKKAKEFSSEIKIEKGSKSVNATKLIACLLYTSFLYLAKKFRKFSGLPEEKFTSLIVIMVRGRAINIYRKNKKCIPLEEIESECANDDITDLVDTEHLRNIISSLSDYDKEVLYLKCVLGMSYKEMSGILSIKESSVRQRMMHARNALKKKLMQEEEQYND